MTVTFSVYQAGCGLEDELARLCSQALHGRTDRRPVTADLVASRLAAGAGQPVTLLAAVRDPDRRLIAAAALRWPYVRTGIGRLWGPVVHPHRQGHRLGTGLLAAISQRFGDPSGLPAVTTTEIPSAATAAHALFTRARWARLDGPLLLRGPIPPDLGTPPPAAVHTAQTTTPTDLAAQISRLYAATYPDHDPRTAHDTLRRWSTDHRYHPSGLLLTGSADQPTAAALLYPLTNHHVDDEPSELLIADLLTDRCLTAVEQFTTCRDLVRAALLHGAGHGATVARAVLPAHRAQAIAALDAAGVTRRDRFTLYTPPTTS
ncbi:GNAT family N-acetyltransferase [Pseudofrankia sp. DC12]|uniref:GNAT family N-acetyltransferase n=1 Tax=Pseudofrankia sp. DC12 TaxID=683315 RepID=UPI0005F85AEB|nr:GNAT family N-acetyltransferase [Pseudofrankia sp. DC12]